MRFFSHRFILLLSLQACLYAQRVIEEEKSVARHRLRYQSRYTHWPALSAAAKAYAYFLTCAFCQVLSEEADWAFPLSTACHPYLATSSSRAPAVMVLLWQM